MLVLLLQSDHSVSLVAESEQEQHVNPIIQLAEIQIGNNTLHLDTSTSIYEKLTVLLKPENELT